MDPRERARRAYEFGRLGVSSLRAAPALLFGLGGLLVAGDGGLRLLASAALTALAVAVMFVGGAAGRAVPAGLVAGGVPFALPLLIRGQVCPLGGSCTAWCMAACVTGGALAGAWLGWRSAREANGLQWLVAAGVTSVAAGALGCSCIGASGAAAMTFASLVTAPVSRALSSR